MADGSVVIRVAADDRDAQKALAQLRRDIEKTARSISTTEEKRNGIAAQLQDARTEAQKTAVEIQAIRDQLRDANMILSGKAGDVSFEDFNAIKQIQSEATVELREQEKLYAKQQATVTKLESQHASLEATLEKEKEQLQQQQEQAGAVGRHLAEQSGHAMPDLRAATEAVSVSMRKGLRNILKWGFGIRSTFILIRRLRSAIVAGVKAFAEQDEETKNNINGLKAALSTLKVSWGAAFAPILNAVAPILQKLISWLTTAANAVQMFFAILGGKSTYKRAIANNEALADSYAGAGGAAADAEKQLMGFDQINKLNDNKSGGGGGGGSAASKFIEESLPTSGFIKSLALSVKDVLFNWKNLNREQIAEKAIAGLSAFLGMGAGFVIGGVPGAIVGTLGGLAIGLIADSLFFDHDGVLSKEELWNTLQPALAGLAGGLIGFALGGPGGAFIGAAVGFGATLLLEGLQLKYGKGYPDFASWFMDKIGNSAKERISGLLKEAWGELVETLSDMWNGIADSWRTIKNDVLLSFKDMGGGITDSWRMIKNNAAEIWNGIKNTISEKINQIKSLLNFSWAIPRPKLPHFSWTWQNIGGILSIPQLYVNWYAKGGIFDKASLVGVGEAGKEAVVPLERNTGWINTLADSLLDRMAEGRYADYITGRALPAFASGQVVPPGTVDREARLSDYDIDRLAKAITSAIGNMATGGSGVQQFVVDGRVLAWANKKYASRAERSDGR